MLHPRSSQAQCKKTRTEVAMKVDDIMVGEVLAPCSSSCMKCDQPWVSRQVHRKHWISGACPTSQEAQLLMNLRHPNIVQVMEVLQIAQFPVLIMEPSSK
jgi:hypothetical protein